jgi:TonB-dependent SusC/RagA subfamily outer membrane receptor
MRATRQILSSLALIAGGALVLAGCASRSATWDRAESGIQARRNHNVLTAEELSEYPPEYAVSRILTEAFPGLWARNAAIGVGSPLVILNGVPGASIADLRVWDVSRIEVQYDAASQAFYGFRGDNGVILVTTVRVAAPDQAKGESETASSENAR